MQNTLRVLIGLSGLLFIVVALGFLLDPAQAAARLGIGAIAPLGLATLRGDHRLLRHRGHPCAARRGPQRRPLLDGAADADWQLAGRLITIAASGFDATMGPPMLVEAVIVVLLVLGRRSLTKR